MPVEIVQSSELQARLRRLTQTVSSQLLSVDNVTLGVTLLGDVARAPYRSEPRVVVGMAFATGAVAPAQNGVLISLVPQGLGRDAALIHEVEVSTTEPSGAAGGFAQVWQSESNAGGAAAFRAEPFGWIGAAPRVLGLGCVGIANTAIGNLQILKQRAFPAGHINAEWFFDPPLVLLGGALQGGTAGSLYLSIGARDAGDVPVDMRGSFLASYFNNVIA